jgi:hypothetical protein
MVIELEKIAGLPILSVAEASDWVKMMVYGVPGSGKTYLCGTSADIERMCPVLFIDIEGGTKTVRKKWPEIKRVRIRDIYNSEGELRKTAWDKLAEVYEALRTGVYPFRTIVVDNLSEAYKLAMDSVMLKTIARDPERDRDIPAQRDWGKTSEMVRRMVRAFRDLDAHVIFTAHEAEVRDPKDGTITIRPSLPGKLASEIPGFLDEVYYLYARPTGEKDEHDTPAIERRILAQPTGKYVAKTRSGLPSVLYNPTMGKIAEIILDKEVVNADSNR